MRSHWFSKRNTLPWIGRVTIWNAFNTGFMHIHGWKGVSKVEYNDPKKNCHEIACFFLLQRTPILSEILTPKFADRVTSQNRQEYDVNSLHVFVDH